MHKIVKIATLILIALSLVSCNASPEKNENEDTTQESTNGFVLVAEVTERTPKRLTVNVIEGEYAYGIYSVIIADDTPITDKSDKTINISDIQVGDTVKITYNGQTMMSSPPQIVARKIVLE